MMPRSARRHVIDGLRPNHGNCDENSRWKASPAVAVVAHVSRLSGTMYHYSDSRLVKIWAKHGLIKLSSCPRELVFLRYNQTANVARQNSKWMHRPAYFTIASLSSRQCHYQSRKLFRKAINLVANMMPVTHYRNDQVHPKIMPEVLCSLLGRTLENNERPAHQFVFHTSITYRQYHMCPYSSFVSFPYHRSAMSSFNSPSK